MYFKEKIQKIISDSVEYALKKHPIEERVGKEIEKLRYDYLPHGACWLCSLPVSRKEGYVMWRGKIFCTELCLNKYADLIQSPSRANHDDNYKVLHGDVIEKFNPRT